MRERESMGQTFPLQGPRDTAEGRVQLVKERLCARQSISGLHLHNKWSFRGFSGAHARTRHSGVNPLRAHQHAPTQGQRDGEGGAQREREKEASYLLEWHSTHTSSLAVSKNTSASGKQTKSQNLYCSNLQL